MTCVPPTWEVEVREVQEVQGGKGGTGGTGGKERASKRRARGASASDSAEGAHLAALWDRRWSGVGVKSVAHEASNTRLRRWHRDIISSGCDKCGAQGEQTVPETMAPWGSCSTAPGGMCSSGPTYEVWPVSVRVCA
eukprot:356882-Chlamydomonas_euryale.AAC.3